MSGYPQQPPLGGQGHYQDYSQTPPPQPFPAYGGGRVASPAAVSPLRVGIAGGPRPIDHTNNGYGGAPPLPQQHHRRSSSQDYPIVDPYRVAAQQHPLAAPLHISNNMSSSHHGHALYDPPMQAPTPVSAHGQQQQQHQGMALYDPPYEPQQQGGYPPYPDNGGVGNGFGAGYPQQQQYGGGGASVPVVTDMPSAGTPTAEYLPNPRLQYGGNSSPMPLPMPMRPGGGLVRDSSSQSTLPDAYPAYPPPPMMGHHSASFSSHQGGGGGPLGHDDLADQPLLRPSFDTARHTMDDESPGLNKYGDPFAGGPAHVGWHGDPDQPIAMTQQQQQHDPNARAHYGPAPDRMIRRLKTTKRVQLFRGNLVLECPVPKTLLEMCPLDHRTEQEFSLMRYTAVTSDADDFPTENYTLRQKQLYEPTRKTEIFIVITMYNEDEELFARTMRGVMANIEHLNNRDRSPTWSQDGWKKVVVCVVVDGRKNFNPRTRAMLAALGCYQEGVAKNLVNGQPVQAHVYEYTTQLRIDSRNQVKPGGTGKKWTPVQMILCVKEQNKKKINSHRWFFNAFAPILKPTVCVLLDVGTQPASTSIYHLWKTFDLKQTCGGACGEIVAMKGKYWHELLNPLVAAQNFEYKLSNILDKPLESAFGWITVLPGAFSAYRYTALANDHSGEGPLKQYFLGETMHGGDAGIFAANMYLAEDRILCWELVSKRNSKWVGQQASIVITLSAYMMSQLLHYVKSARAITDVPDAVPELISQRRRWLNGSFFAAIHSIVHFGYIYRSSHSFGRKFFLHLELIYQLVQIVFAWFSLGNFYIAFFVLTASLETSLKWTKYINIPLNYIYLGLLIMCFVLALGNRPAGAKIAYTVSMVGFSIITCYMSFCAIYLAVTGIQAFENQGNVTAEDVISDSTFRNIILSLAATYGIYLLASLLAFDPWHMFTSLLQYLMLAPSYINVLNVYAFSNVHDVSWGTKGSDKVSMDLGAASTGKGAKDGEVLIAVPTDDKDINEIYADELRLLAEPAPKVKQVRAESQKAEDYYKTFRTNVLLAWVLSNGLLAGIILTTSTGSGTYASIYMGILLYTVAALAAFRFLGATIYLVVRLFQRE